MAGHANHARNARAWAKKGPPEWLRDVTPIVVGATYITPYGWIKPRQVLRILGPAKDLSAQRVVYRRSQTGQHHQCNRAVFVSWMTENHAKPVMLNGEGMPAVIEGEVMGGLSEAKAELGDTKGKR